MALKYHLFELDSDCLLCSFNHTFAIKLSEMVSDCYSYDQITSGQITRCQKKSCAETFHKTLQIHYSMIIQSSFAELKRMQEASAKVPLITINTLQKQCFSSDAIFHEKEVLLLETLSYYF